MNNSDYPKIGVKSSWFRFNKLNKKHLFLDFIFLLGFLFLVAVNVFWVLGGFNYFHDKVDLKVSVVGDVIAGADTVFRVDYANRNKFRISDAVLSFEYPADIIFYSASHQDFDFDHQILKISNLEPGANGSLILTGKNYQDFGSKQLIKVGLNYYKSDNKGSKMWGQFAKKTTLEYEIIQSILSWNDNLPIEEKIFTGQEINWKIYLENKSFYNLENLKIVKNFPESILLKEEFAEITVPSKSNFFLEDFFVFPLEESEVNFSYDIYWQTLERKFLLAKIDKNFSLVNFPLQVEVESFQKTLSFDDFLTLKIKIQNSQPPIKNVKIGINVDEQLWSFEKSELAGGLVTDGQIIFDQDSWTELEYLEKNKKTEKELKLFLPNNSLLSNPQIFVEPFLIMNDKKIFGKKFSWEVMTDLGLSVYPIYFAKSGDQLGRGPLPAQVGFETKYWLMVKLLNELSEVKDVVVKIELADGVIFTGNSNVPFGQPVRFDTIENSLIWRIDQLPAPAGSLGFAVEVGLTPTQNDIGTFPVLAESLMVEGIDSLTGEKINKKYDAVTSQIKNDEKGENMDSVVIE